MRRLYLFILLGFAAVVMVLAFSAMSPTAEEEEDVAQTVRFLLGSPTDPEDRKAVEDFNEFIRMATKLGLSRV